MRRLPALVLTAGLGTRLRPLTYLRAKAAVPVNGISLARRVSRWLAAHGVRDQVFNLHYLPATVAGSLGDGSADGVRLRYSWEHPVLGSAGGPRHALPLLVDGGYDRFLLVNGDTLTNVDLDGLIAAHERTGALVTLALIPNPAPDKYGGVIVNAQREVLGFSRRGTVAESHHFIGVQIAERRVFETLEDGVPYESVGALYPDLMRSHPGSVRAFLSDASFRDIGTPADYLQTSLELAADEGDRLVSATASIHPDAVVERSSVWDDVVIGSGAVVRDCVIGDGVHISDGARYARCAIVPAGAHTVVSDEQIVGGLLIRAL